MSCFELDDLKCQLLVALSLIFTVWLLLNYLKTPKNLPPGPWGLPLVGYKFFLGKKPPITIANLRKKYGDVIRINLGNEYATFVTSYSAIKEALVKQGDTFAGRHKLNVHPGLEHRPGILRSSGEMWSELRRFSLTKLRDFGFGKSSLEPQIMDEIQHFLKMLESAEQPIANMRDYIRQSVANVICLIMTGERLDYGNKMIQELMDTTDEHATRVGIDRLLFLIPKPLRFKVLLNLFGIKSATETIMKIFNLMYAAVEKADKKHEFGREDNFIDAWLTEAKKPNTKSKYLTKEQLPTVLLDLFLAGSDTTTNTLGWSLLYMIAHPHIQAKIQKEIDDVIGTGRTPSMADQKLMPFTEATLTEVSRIVTIAPMTTHSAQVDATLLGKFIPKDGTIIFNFWAVHHDPEIFPDPFTFKPERFLTEKGEIKRIEEFIPFGTGKRQCLGETLARMELFLFFTSLLQHFTFEKVNPTVDFDYNYATVTIPKPQPIRILLRNT